MENDHLPYCNVRVSLTSIIAFLLALANSPLSLYKECPMEGPVTRCQGGRDVNNLHLRVAVLPTDAPIHGFITEATIELFREKYDIHSQDRCCQGVSLSTVFVISGRRLGSPNGFRGRPDLRSIIVKLGHEDTPRNLDIWSSSSQPAKGAYIDAAIPES